MSTIIDTLAETISDAITNGDTTRAEWEQALAQVYDGSEQDAIDPLAEATSTDYELRWAIDYTGPSPAEASARVWREVFGRGPQQPNDDEACVFEAAINNRRVHIDLSEERYASLFE